MLSAKKKAVVFDLDGTIIDTIDDIAAAVNRALEAFGYSGHTVAEITSFLGNGSLMLMRRALDVWDNDDLCFNVRERFRVEYEKGMFDQTKPYDGIKELLQELSAKGIATAVVTNKDDKCAVPMIKRYFGDLVTVTRGVRCDTDRKPNPQVTLQVLDKLGVSPEEALFVGDGSADVNVAKNCNIQLIPVGYGYTSREKLVELCGIEPAQSVTELRRKLFEYFE